MLSPAGEVLVGSYDLVSSIALVNSGVTIDRKPKLLNNPERPEVEFDEPVEFASPLRSPVSEPNPPEPPAPVRSSIILVMFKFCRRPVIEVPKLEPRNCCTESSRMVTIGT